MAAEFEKVNALNVCSPSTSKETAIRPNHDEMKSTTSSAMNISSNYSERRPTHEAWTSEQTLFLISLMQNHLLNCDETPKSIADLENKIRLGRGQQKLLWAEFTDKLSESFNKVFDPKRVARKWQTLIDGFKKAILNNSTTGNAPTKFAFYKEMNNLIGDRHDINFVVTATAEDITIHRPSEIGQVEEIGETYVYYDTGPSQDLQPGSSNPVPTDNQVKVSSKKRKRKSNDGDEILKYMKESDREMAERTDRIVDNMERFQNTFQDMMGRLLDKI